MIISVNMASLIGVANHSWSEKAETAQMRYVRDADTDDGQLFIINGDWQC